MSGNCLTRTPACMPRHLLEAWACIKISAELLLREARQGKVRELLEEQLAPALDDVMRVTGLKSPL